ncbi:MAG TPA: DUF3011 domain-containing protein [Luteimonas sp.]|nr:DUF3011 domain-containing protein [Luteimonas sp.]
MNRIAFRRTSVRMAGRVAAALAVAGLAGCVGYGYPGDYGAYPPNQGYPDYSPPGNGYPGSGGYGGTFRCESDNNRTRHCDVDTRGGVRMNRQLSDSPCVQGRTWGYDNRGVWVSNGCRAEFIAGRGGYGPGYGSGGGYGRTIRCESQDKRQRRCNVSVTRGVDIVRQLSDTRCVQGQNWGWDRGGIWVSGGCRAEFSVR